MIKKIMFPKDVINLTEYDLILQIKTKMTKKNIAKYVVILTA